MGRPPRLDPEAGWHHVMNRGVARQTVFHSASDGAFFEHLLAVGHEDLGVEVHAYCLMSNHFHLLLHCPQGGLSAFMQQLSSRYTRHHNQRLGRDGPVFRGRFRSLLVDSDRYLAAVGRYVHRNPTDLRPTVALADYRWSSLRHYRDPRRAPYWLRTDVLMRGHHGPIEYCHWVEAGANDVATTPVWAIGTAIAELTDEPSVGAFDRTVAVVMLALLPAAQARQVEASLAFPSDGARRTALSRARRRYQTDPTLRSVVERACQLLQVRVTNCV